MTLGGTRWVLWLFPCLAAAAPARLFDGVSLKGWRILGAGSWTVSDSAIVARQSAGEARFTHLVADTVVKDFRASFLFKSARGNAGFFFRLGYSGADPDSVAGVQAVIEPGLAADEAFGLYETGGREWLRKWDYARHQNQYPGGNECMMIADQPKLSATQGIVPGNCRKTLYIPGDWNRLSVWAKGPRLIVKLNMRTIVDTSDPSLDKPGRFAFKLHAAQDVEIRFKDVEISPWNDMPAGLKSRLQRALMYKGEAGVSPPSLREYVREIANENGIAVDEGTETAFTKANLARYQTALFLSDYNVNLNAAERADFQDWFSQGRGAVCMHACTRQEVTMAWPWWGEATGGQLADHTSFKSRSVALDAEAAGRPLWKGFSAAPVAWRDEWFHWVQSPRGKPGITVLSSYADAGDPADQAPKGLPHAWLSSSQGGRFFAWGAMHTMNTMELPYTYDFLLNALREAGGYDTVAVQAMPAPASAAAWDWARSEGCWRISGAGPFRVTVRDPAGRTLAAREGDAGRPALLQAPADAGIVYVTVSAAGKSRTRKLAAAQGAWLE